MATTPDPQFCRSCVACYVLGVLEGRAAIRKVPGDSANTQFQIKDCSTIEIINNKARHYLIDAKCRWRSDRLDGCEFLGTAWSKESEPERREQNYKGAITQEVCCLAAQCNAASICFCFNLLFNSSRNIEFFNSIFFNSV